MDRATILKKFYQSPAYFFFTGHLAAAVGVHSLCNAMGMPDIASEMQISELHDPQWGRCVYIALLLIGFTGWLVLIGPASTLFGLSDSTSCRLL